MIAKRLISLLQPSGFLRCLTSSQQSATCISHKIAQYCYGKNKFIKRTDDREYHVVTEQEILAFLKLNSIKYRVQRAYAQLQFCPFCIKKNFEDITNQYTMGINLTNGTYRCFRSSCQASGKWLDYLRHMEQQQPELTRVDFPTNSLQKQQHTEQLRVKEQKYEEFEYHKHFQRMKIQDPYYIYEYLVGIDWKKNQRGISESVLTKYLIGIGIDEVYDSVQQTKIRAPLVYFPMFKLLTIKHSKSLMQHPKQSTQSIQYQYDKTMYELVSCKLRGAGKELKHIQKIDPVNAVKGIFGLQLLQPDEKQIIITEGEFDAMAAFQMTGITSISLPYGISHYPNYLTQWLNQYRSLKDIILWVDDDDHGKLHSQKIAKQIGIERTRLVQPSLVDSKYYPKDANDCLRFYPDKIKDYIAKSQKIK